MSQPHAVASSRRCLVGFDGFVDSIIDVVDERTHTGFTTMRHIRALADRIATSSGKSCNIELVETRRKLGGNGPIMGLALARQGCWVDYIGTVDDSEVFTPLADYCHSVTSLAPPGKSEALEFSDGKVILGHLGSLHTIGWEQLVNIVGLDRWVALVDACDLLATVNWTMLPHMNEIWRTLIDLVVPRLSSKRRYLFVDLADPRKRRDKEMMEMMEQLTKLEEHFSVVLGVNESEAHQLLGVLGTAEPSDLAAMATALRSRLDLSIVVAHSRGAAASADRRGTYQKDVVLCDRPKLNTGAGDNFNAGFCAALLRDAPLEEALLAAHQTASYYVREGESPCSQVLSQQLASASQLPEGG